MADIVQQLRNLSQQSYTLGAPNCDVMASAADEIERLRERCDAYEGQVRAGEIEIETLRAHLNEQQAEP